MSITPLPEAGKPEFLQEMIADAVNKGETLLCNLSGSHSLGAKVVNTLGSRVDRTLVSPTVLFPVTSTMKCYHEEQFGPVVPIATFSTLDQIYDYLAACARVFQEYPFGLVTALALNLASKRLCFQLARRTSRLSSMFLSTRSSLCYWHDFSLRHGNFEIGFSCQCELAVPTRS